MVGNIWEWCLNKPEGISLIHTENPKDDVRVVRSGGYFDSEHHFVLPFDNDFEWDYANEQGEGGEVAFRLVKYN